MKRTSIITVFSLTMLLGLTLFPSYIFTESTQPSPGSTGAPGENTCTGSSCHSGSSQVNGNVLKFSTLAPAGDLDNGYTPNQSYNLLVNVFEGFKPTKGFQITAVDQNGDGAGNFVIVQTQFTSIQTQGNRQYLGHKNATGVNAFNFQWEAPSSDIGAIDFYLTAVAADGTGSGTGDDCYKAQYRATTSSFTNMLSTGISEPTNVGESDGISVFPNPVVDEVNLSMQLAHELSLNIGLYDLTGRKIRHLFDGNESSSFTKSWPLKGLENGIYVMLIESGEHKIYKKLLVE